MSNSPTGSPPPSGLAPISRASGRILDIAIASVDIAGPFHCGGVGAAYHGLALALAAAGHHVTILYLHDKFHQGAPADWAGYFAGRGIRFVHLPQPPESPIWYANRKEASWRCYRWLAAQPPFDVIHFHEWLGVPYYSLLAKRQGLAFAQTTLCVGTHGSMRWSRDGEQTLPARAEDLVVDFLERKSVELADAAISPSEYLLHWMREDGWRLPAASFAEHNLLELCGPAGGLATAGAQPAPVRELVFFGRLEQRKGLPFFCDVLDRLNEIVTVDFSVTFLGRNAVVDGKPSPAYIASRARAWRNPPKLLTNYGRCEALEYLSGPDRLAVIPSLIDNSPCTIQECVEQGIPFLTSDRGGIPELIAPDDRERVICRLDRDLFAARLADALAHGHLPGRPAESLARARENWLRWHASLPERSDTPQPAASVTPPDPLVSVCIAHHRRPGQLAQMLDSLRGQSWPNFEVIVVDDGSADDASQAYLASLAADFAARGWRLLYQPNAGPGAARDRAARTARGEWLLFGDDDDAFFPHAIETFVRVGERTGAHALSSVLMEFEGAAVPTRLEDALRPLIPLGAALAPGLICPEFGGTAYMLRRDCYFEIGGFSLERDCDEDWELLLTVVAKGYQLEAIPEPLVWYRAQPASRSRASNRFTRNRSRLRIYEKLLPLELRDLAALAFSRLAAAPDAGTQRRLERVIQSLEKLQRARPKPD